MALIVQKYGGTSVGSIERIRNVARRVAKWKTAGHDVVVVPSAMSGETNRMLALARQHHHARTRRLRHFGSRAGGCAEGRRMPDLHRRGRRIHDRPAHGSRSAP